MITVPNICVRIRCSRKRALGAILRKGLCSGGACAAMPQTREIKWFTTVFRLTIIDRAVCIHVDGGAGAAATILIVQEYIRLA